MWKDKIDLLTAGRSGARSAECYGVESALRPCSTSNNERFFAYQRKSGQIAWTKPEALAKSASTIAAAR
jgi:hypothetical protein